MQRTMALAKRLKKRNKKLSESIKTLEKKLEKWYKYPTIEADEFDEVRSTVRKLGFCIAVVFIAEAALNYFGVSAVITAKGLWWMALNIVIAIAFTAVGIYLFKKVIAVILNKPMYKQAEVPARNWVEFGIVAIFCVAYEIAIYYLCKVRGSALEGGHGNSIITNFVILAGMLLPILAGYFTYERSRYLSPYNTIKRIEKAERKISQKTSKIATNKQRMEDHFKIKLQDTWAMLDEFKVYKGNYNSRHSIPDEDLSEHFCETHESYEYEAVQRYKKEVLQNPTTMQAAFINTKELLNGHSKEIPQMSVNL